MFGGAGNFNPLTNSYRQVGETANGLPVHIETHMWLEVRENEKQIRDWWPHQLLRGYALRVGYKNHRTCDCLLSRPRILFKAHDSELYGDFPVSNCIRNFWALQLMRENPDCCLAHGMWEPVDGQSLTLASDANVTYGGLHALSFGADRPPSFYFTTRSPQFSVD